MKNTIENAKMFLAKNTNFNPNSGMGEIISSLMVLYARQVIFQDMVCPVCGKKGFIMETVEGKKFCTDCECYF